MDRRRLILFIVSLLSLFLFGFHTVPQTKFNYNPGTMMAPHTQAMACEDCHITMTGRNCGLSNFSSCAQYLSTSKEDTPANNLCLSCHKRTAGPYWYPDGAPKARTHSDRAVSNNTSDTWSYECRHCHDPHKQDSDSRNTSVYMGTFTSTNSVYGGAGTSTFTVSGVVWESGWGTTDMTAKGGYAFHSAIVVVDDNWNYTYKVIAYTPVTSIIVRGDITGAPFEGGASSLKVYYGMMLWDKIHTPTGKKDVSPWFGGVSNATMAGYAYDEGGTGTDSTPTGICQICHTTTAFWRSDGTSASHQNGNMCTDCHRHSTGFAPPDHYAPASQSLSGFTEGTGGYANADEPDNVRAQYDEPSGGTNHYVEYTYTSVDSGTFWGKVLFEGYYTGGHTVSVQIYDNNLASWETLGSLSTLKSADEYKEWTGAVTASDYVDGSNQVKVRFFHSVGGNPTHDLYIDMVVIR